MCVAALLVAAACVGCSNTAAPPAAPTTKSASTTASAADSFAAIATLDMRLADDSTTTPVLLPRDFTGSRWDAIQSACASVGSDLRPYAGEKVILTSWVFVNSPEGYPKGMTVIEHQGRLIGVFTLANGVYRGIPKSRLGAGDAP